MDTKELEAMERLLFANIVGELAKGSINKLIESAPSEVREEMGRVWDKHCSVPVGTLFQRPNFEGK